MVKLVFLWVRVGGVVEPDECLTSNLCHFCQEYCVVPLVARACESKKVMASLRGCSVLMTLPCLKKWWLAWTLVWVIFSHH